MPRGRRKNPWVTSSLLSWSFTVSPFFSVISFGLNSNRFAVESAPETAPRSSVRQGYAWIHWSHAGMRYWVVSDVAPAELEQLARLLRR